MLAKKVGRITFFACITAVPNFLITMLLISGSFTAGKFC